MEWQRLRPHPLFDHVMRVLRIKTDRQLAELLDVEQSYVSRMRHRKQRITAAIILAIHEATDLPIKTIKELAERSTM